MQAGAMTVFGIGLDGSNGLDASRGLAGLLGEQRLDERVLGKIVGGDPGMGVGIGKARVVHFVGGRAASGCGEEIARRPGIPLAPYVELRSVFFRVGAVPPLCLLKKDLNWLGNFMGPTISAWLLLCGYCWRILLHGRAGAIDAGFRLPCAGF